MNKPLPPGPFYVLIVAKTRLKTGYCVGGIAQNGRSVRLSVPAKLKTKDSNQECKIGDVWLIEEYTIPKKLKPPHSEDIDVHSKRYVKESNLLHASIEQFMPPVVGGIGSLFDGAVQRASNGRLVVTHQNVPGFSTQFWRPDRPLRLTMSSTGKFRYVYEGTNGESFMSYVGTAKANPVLDAGTLVRLSLARWYQNDAMEEEACFLQVSGWYDENGGADESNEPEEPVEIVGSIDPDDSGNNGSHYLPIPHREPIQADLLEPLKRYFGFQEFRPYQREIVESVLARQDTFVVMSTGAGKSLCYQLPALVFRGLTVVISPLISLMQDQVTKLEQYGIAVATLNSQTSAGERGYIRRQIQRGQLKLLYISPEKLVLPATLELLKESNLECLVIDEAHCISQWGHDFRPDYREILNVQKELGDIPIIALTATATPEVRKDIVKNLTLRKVNEFVAPFNRPNLFLAVQPRHNGTQQVLDFLAQHPGQSGIIYCSTQKGVDALTEKLQQADIPALSYHAGLEDETRKQNQHSFVHDEGRVMVATIAFGMGIDKPDVRFVLHFNLPNDPESYYQQIGRAGRDGARADCLLLHGRDDFGTIKYWIAQGDPARAPQATARMQHMAAWIKEFTCRRKWLLEYFGEDGAADNCGMCDACVVSDSTRDEGTQIEGRDDITIYASLFLSCVKQVRQSFGTTHIISILRGSKAKKLLQWKHEQLPVYTQGNMLTEKGWKDLVSQFFQLGLVTQNDMGVVKLTQRGHDVLDGEKVFGLMKSKRRSAATKLEAGDAELFEKLRTLRRQLAEERGMPSFFIFYDRTLRDMATHMPQTPAEFLQIHGVGEHKSVEFGPAFLEVIRGHGNPCQEPTAPVLDVGRPTTGRNGAQQRREIAIAGLQAGKSLDVVAVGCGVQPTTILRYVYDHYKKERVIPAGIILPPSQVSEELREQVFTHFTERGTDALGPIYWAMDQKVEYIDLDLLRIEYLQLVS